MATQYTGWGCTHSTEIIAENNTSITIRVHCYWQNLSWRYDVANISAWVYCGNQSAKVLDKGAVNSKNIDNTAALWIGSADFSFSKTHAAQSISCYAAIDSDSSYAGNYTRSSSASSVSVAAKPTHTITYNANGGTGAPGNQTKWYNESITLSSTKPTRTGHNFVRWNTNTSNTGTGYNPGATYNSNANLTLYAIWTPHTYTVSYNANGGSGAPGNQTKTYGVNLTLSSTKPTRTNYNFKGWSTSAGGSVVYAAGATYTNNSAVTLYAVWELAYVKPRVTNLTANRCNSDGTLNESGTYIKVTFNWATDRNQTCINIDWKAQSASSWTVLSAGASGTTSGSVSKVIGGGAASIETSYYVRIYVEDSGGNTLSGQVSVGTVKFPIDVKSGGKGVAIGKVAETADLFDVNWKTRFRNGITDTKVYDPNKTDGNDGYHARPIIREHFITVQGAGWRYIGDFYFGFQGQHAALDCYFGDGQNGNAEQNSHARIILKQGWSGNELPIGVTTRFTQNTQKSVKVKIAHMSKGSCSLYIYLPWSYSELTYIVSGSYSGFTPKNTVSTSTPTTDKESTYYYTSPLDMYPVGSIYMNWSRSKTPAELFGGTWVQMTGGFLYGSVNTSTSSEGSTGNGTGTSTTAHAITEAQMPSHRHKGLLWSGVEVITLNEGSGAGYNLKYGGGNNYQNEHVQTALTGGGQGHSHGVPYMAVMIWRRTA